MRRTYVEEVEERIENETSAVAILAIDPEEYTEKLREYTRELHEILKTGRFSKASIELLRWLGFGDEEIDQEKILKAIAIIRWMVYTTNALILERSKGRS